MADLKKSTGLVGQKAKAFWSKSQRRTRRESRGDMDERLAQNEASFLQTALRKVQKKHCGKNEARCGTRKENRSERAPMFDFPQGPRANITQGDLRHKATSSRHFCFVSGMTERLLRSLKE